jgi:enoyl-CoA hydratase/carnithine racemase
VGDSGESGLGVEALDQGAIARLTISRPERGNSLTAPLLERLERATADLAGAGALAAILTGAGEKSVCTGYDVEALQVELAAAVPVPVASPPPEDPLASHPLERALEAMVRSSVPIVAAIGGAATGAGLELACACDLRVVGEGARFLMPPARLGLVYSPTVIARILAVVGAAATRELFMLAEPIDARRAEALGLATRVVPDAEVSDAALAMARRLAANAPLSIAGVKMILDRHLLAPRLDPGALAEIADLRARALASRDLAEGLAAFLEKRTPRFEGR